MLYIHITKKIGKENKIYEYTNQPVLESRMCSDCQKCSQRKLTEEELIERVIKLGNK